MADHDLAIIAGVSTSYTGPNVCIVKGSESSPGEVPAANIAVKFNNVPIGEDPGNPDSDVTPDPKVFSYSYDPVSEDAHIILDRHHPGRVIPPEPPYASTLSKFPSNLSAADMEAAIASDSAPYLTTWGGSTDTPSGLAAVNLYGVTRLGNVLLLASYDVPRVTQVNLLDDSVVGAVDFTPQAGLKASVQSMIKLPNGTVIAMINEAVNPWGATPALAGYAPATLVEVVPGVNGGSPAFSATNRVTVSETVDGVDHKLLNAFKLAYADGNILVAGFGGPQMYGQSNAQRSTLFKIPVSNAGVLGAPSVVYHGYGDESFYDIRDIAVSDNAAMILLGVYGVDYRTFTYLLLRQPLNNALDPDGQPVTGLLNTHAADIMDLVCEAWAVIDGDNVSGGACHAVEYGKTYKHFWAAQSTRLRAYDYADIGDLAAAPELKVELGPSDYYGGNEAYINSFDVFSNNTIYIAPSPIRHAHGGIGAGASVVGRRRVARDSKAAMRAFIDKARAMKKRTK